MGGFQDYFATVASSYAAFRPGYPPPLFDWLRSVTSSGGLVWDCACGSGQATFELSRRFERVIATDASLAQLAAADRGGRPSWAVAAAERVPLRDASADAVTVAQALHWFAGERFFDEVLRVLRPGGIFAAWTYGMPHIHHEPVDRAVVEFYRNTVGPFWPPERRLVEQGYRSIELPFAELAAPRFELTADWTLSQVLGYLRSWSATARFVAVRGVDPVADFADRLRSLWGQPDRHCAVTWPLVVRVGRR